MTAVADRAGVATGTAYVHYQSKDDLVLGAYVEVKAALAAIAATASGGSPRELFNSIWLAIHSHLATDPVQAQFLVQVESSPYAVAAHEAALGSAGLLEEDQFAALKNALVALPPLVLWDLGMGPAIRAVAFGTELTAGELDELAAACWRAVGRS